MKSKAAKYRPLMYPEVMEKYERANLPGITMFENPSEVLEVLGVDLYKIKGVDALLEKDRVIVINTILKYLNGWGLEYRETINPRSIEWVESKNVFKLTFTNKRYLYLNKEGVWY